MGAMTFSGAMTSAMTRKLGIDVDTISSKKSRAKDRVDAVAADRWAMQRMRALHARRDDTMHAARTDRLIDHHRIGRAARRLPDRYA